MNFLDRLFKSKQNNEPVHPSRVEITSGSPATFTPFSGNAYENDIFRSAVDAIARNVAKLKPCHVIYGESTNTAINSELNRVLQVSPNPYMSTYDFLYKLVTHYYLYNNAFACLQKDDKENLQAIYPLSPYQMEYLSDKEGQLYCHFKFKDGKDLTLRNDDVIILRRFFNSNDLLGDNNSALYPVLDLAHTQSQGLTHSIKSSAVLKGILKFTNVLSPTKLKEEKEAFIQDYLNINNNGGVAVIDNKAEYIPLSHASQVTIDDKQLEAIKLRIYGYLGISEKIVSSDYTEDIWSSFYESVIEPFAIQLGLEMTGKTFTSIEQNFGHAIILTSNRLQYSSNQTKIQLLKELLPMGLFTLDQALEILNLAPVGGEEGKKRLQSLNYIDQAKANMYQVGRFENARNTKHLNSN